MERDLDLIRKILLTMENEEPLNALRSSDYTEDKINYHLSLLYDAGFIKARVYESRNRGASPVTLTIPEGLTWKGHDFLDNARNDTFWNKAKNMIEEKGGSVSVAVLSQLLASIAKKAVDLT